MQDYAEASLWDLSYDLDPTDAAMCSEIDPHLAGKLENMERLLEIYYYLCYGDMHTLLPLTKKRINELLSDELKDLENIKWYQFKNFVAWLDDGVKQSLAKEWLNNDEIELDDAWMADSISTDTNTNLQVLTKLVRMYKKKKSSQSIKIMEKVFLNFESDRIDEACDVISQSTPAVAATLLRRTDISEKFTIKGLKALSKLYKQRDVEIQIDFDMLKHLGPKGRLDAMKQLMGMFDKYYQFVQKNKDDTSRDYGYSYRERRLKRNAKEYNLPFKEMPKREDVERFLFPCSLRYNDEVVAMIGRFNELSQKEEE
ncbi:hypothetical protein LCGC14_1454950 [marine sediment metagenome]|uniref:Uncharacterized protein n=1 Tax=marine sediment metagenome TaxID=412755 RepID=A0A0F9MIM3_9ZZZZ